MLVVAVLAPVAMVLVLERSRLSGPCRTVGWAMSIGFLGLAEALLVTGIRRLRTGARKTAGKSPASFPAPGDFTSAKLKSFCETSGVEERTKIELQKWMFEKRLDYARYFFDHHAKQRMSMFNFFLVFVGLSIPGYASLLKNGDVNIASVLAMCAAALTVIFIMLDRRNEELVHITEDVLSHLERDALFADYERMVWLPKRRTWWGGMDVHLGPQAVALGIFRRQTADDENEMVGRSSYEHGWLLPAFQFVICLLFVLLALFPWVPPRAVILACVTL